MLLRSGFRIGVNDDHLLSWPPWESYPRPNLPSPVLYWNGKDITAHKEKEENKDDEDEPVLGVCLKCDAIGRKGMQCNCTDDNACLFVDCSFEDLPLGSEEEESMEVVDGSD